MRFLHALWLSLIVFIGPVAAHEVRPALLQITERSDGRYDVLWKQPIQGEVAVRLVPHIDDLLDRTPSTIETTSSAQIRIWHAVDVGPGGLDGRKLDVEGLGQTITDVLLTMTLKDGTQTSDVLRPELPWIILHSGGRGLAVPAYLTLGIEHILTGVDHLCFVLGLLLLVRNRWMLVKTVSAFTVAHSITLAATALHIIAVRPALIEALVALSILFVATELVHAYRGRAGLTARMPWLIAFVFGLLHGAAFAGALAEVGLPQNAIPLSLLLFNVGVEMGQLLFIAAVLSVGWAIAHLPQPLPVWTRWVPPYAIGSFAAVWFLERLQAAIV